MCFRGSAGPIKSIEKLASVLKLQSAFLVDVASRSDLSNYKPVPAPQKKNGQMREVYSPSRDVRLIQKRIVEVFFKDRTVIKWPNFIFGGIHKSALQPGDVRDHVACAKVHCQAKSLLKLDVEDFFGNVNFDLVMGVFSGLLGWSEDAATLAARLCTRDGRLPQGGITSSYIALLCLYDVEPKLVRILSYKRLSYTRYVDDITVSSKSSSYDFESIIKMIDSCLVDKGLTINPSKIDQQTVGLRALNVHGLNISFERPVLPKSEVRRIKSVCKQTAMDAKDVGRRTSVYLKRYSRAMGLVNKLARVGNAEHKKFVRQLNSVRPLPSYSDYLISTEIGLDLRSRYVERKADYWYWRRFNKLMSRLDLIAIESPEWAGNLRKYMRSHFRPEFDCK